MKPGCRYFTSSERLHVLYYWRHSATLYSQHGRWYDPVVLDRMVMTNTSSKRWARKGPSEAASSPICHERSCTSAIDKRTSEEQIAVGWWLEDNGICLLRSAIRNIFQLYRSLWRSQASSELDSIHALETSAHKFEHRLMTYV